MIRRDTLNIKHSSRKSVVSVSSFQSGISHLLLRTEIDELARLGMNHGIVGVNELCSCKFWNVFLIGTAIVKSQEIDHSFNLKGERKRHAKRS